MTGRRSPGDYIHKPRKDRMYEERVQDPYLARKKYREPTVCPDCRAVYQAGRWQWSAPEKDAAEHRCPACQRVHDRVPAGTLSVTGDFYADHRDEIRHLIRNLETREKVEHPLERIMDWQSDDSGLTVSFTGRHLVRAAGEALLHAYQGELDYIHGQRDEVMRVSWHR